MVMGLCCAAACSGGGHWVGLERLVYSVLFPALLIHTIAQADLSRVPVGGLAVHLLAR